MITVAHLRPWARVAANRERPMIVYYEGTMTGEEAERILSKAAYWSLVEEQLRPLPNHVREMLAPILVEVAKEERQRAARIVIAEFAQAATRPVTARTIAQAILVDN